MKVSNAAEDPATLDMEALVVLHIGRVDPTLPVAVPGLLPAPRRRRIRRRGVVPRSSQGRAARTGCGRTTCSRAVPVPSASELSDEAIVAWGETSARLTPGACAASSTPARSGTMPWDVQHAVDLRPMLADIARPRAARHRRRRPRPVRRTIAPRCGVAARPGRPWRPDPRQRPGRRRRLHHRDHRLRRHEPHRADRPTWRRCSTRWPSGVTRRRAVPGRPAAARRLPAGHAARARRARAAR